MAFGGDESVLQGQVVAFPPAQTPHCCFEDRPVVPRQFRQADDLLHQEGCDGAGGDVVGDRVLVCHGGNDIQPV